MSRDDEKPRPRVRFSQVAHSMPDEQPQVWDDDRLLATYMRMKVAADRQWREAADVPRRVTDTDLQALEEAGLIRVNGDRYRMPEVDDARGQASEQGKAGARRRWQS